ncbi:phospholipase D-like domain-containing protein [Actinomadura mexicana]|uniref:phospholipase D n=1 Tax=Actinomadura mexicana TaxID=134959 RepID=A0A239AW32_9ACTN|nr:phosphatidylserine/phosphatidylglycerophosphate/cardiolipin synthase family protein [Actinomadura mexicana]SNR99817.1 Phosphatidylserine/phosphatidylglycerophosphate/cardiolipin synthase [Actinomadura mexicana]
MTDEIDVGAKTVEGDYFLNRPGWKSRPFTAGGNVDGNRHCVTYRNSDQSIRHALISLVKSARRKIFIASFFLGDAELAQELVAAAQRLVGGVYVISAIDDRSLRRGLDELEDGDIGVGVGGERRDPAEHKRFDKLVGSGVYVRGHENCHAKFAVADDETALVTSANFTTRALEKTGESGVLVHDAIEARRLARLFARLWHEGCTWEIPPMSHHEKYTAERRSPAAWAGTVPQPGFDSSYGVIWTDGQDQHILRHLQRIVTGAREELLLATWSLNGMSRHPELLLEPVKQATRRGVRVRMLVRVFNDRLHHRADAGTFADAGVEIVPDTLTHAKGAIADSRRGALFSANFDREHGLTSGVEAGWRLDGTPLLDEARAYFQHAMDNADAEFARTPSQRDLHDRLITWKLQRWPLPRRMAVEATSLAWKSLASGVEAGPVLFTVDGDGEVELLVDRHRFAIRQNGMDVVRLEISPHVEPKPSDQRLEEWLRTRGVPATGTRGVCPAVFELSV